MAFNISSQCRGQYQVKLKTNPSFPRLSDRPNGLKIDLERLLRGFLLKDCSLVVVTCYFSVGWKQSQNLGHIFRFVLIRQRTYQKEDNTTSIKKLFYGRLPKGNFVYLTRWQDQLMSACAGHYLPQQRQGQTKQSPLQADMS